MKIAEGLVLRKHLVLKVEQLKPLKMAGDQGIFEQKIERRNVTDTVDEISLQVAKVTLAEVTAEYDKYSKALRELDTALQRANWKFDVDFTPGEGINI